MSSTTGRIPVHQSTRPVELGRAAYASSDLQPRVASTGRYAMPTEGKPYKWRDPDRLTPIVPVRPIRRVSRNR